MRASETERHRHLTPVPAANSCFALQSRRVYRRQSPYHMQRTISRRQGKNTDATTQKRYGGGSVPREFPTAT